MDTGIKYVDVNIYDTHYVFRGMQKDVNETFSQTVFISPTEKLTQPYWLVEPMEKGSFNVRNQQLIGNPENVPVSMPFTANIYGESIVFDVPVRYKFTDPIRGEVYEPLAIYPPLIIEDAPTVKNIIFFARWLFQYKI